MGNSTLYYVADPMCSWCWGFAPVLEQVVRTLPDDTVLRWVMGGLAPDSDTPMPDATRHYVQEAWRAVASRTGASFNWDFWDRCAPRRSTFPACRAVLAAAAQDPTAGPAMFAAIQRAYYRQARNPSDLDTLRQLARELTPSLDGERFDADLVSTEVDARLQGDLALRAALRADGLPSLVLDHGGHRAPVWRGYGSFAEVQASLRVARQRQ